MQRILRENGLILVMTSLFVFALLGQIFTGWFEYNDQQIDHDGPTNDLSSYLTTGHFGEALFENWESEFLQMGVFVLLTVHLRQKGSPESKAIDGTEAVDREPDPRRSGAPWPVRAGGLTSKLYRHSLGITLIGLFAVTFALHVVGGAAEASADQLAHGGTALTPVDYLGTSRLWFESFQNWQSEFMSIAALIGLSIFLREKGSPESKPVDAPHDQTGGD